MRLLLFSVVLFGLGAVSCGSESTSVSSFDRIPTAIAFDWLNAVTAGDGAAIAGTVEQNGLVIVAAAENAFSLEETASLLDAGMSDTMADTYWATFRQEYIGFAGTRFGDLGVGVYTEFDAGGLPFAVVTLQGEGGMGSVVTSRGGAGWQVDMAATVGPAFVTQIRRMAEGLDDTPSSVLVMNAMARHVLPGLLAAVQLDPTNRQLADDVARIEAALPAIIPAG